MTSPPTAEFDERLVGSDRVLAVLAELAGRPEGVSLDEIARVVCSPKPTVHRALAALRRAGFAAQDGRGHYVLGDEFLRLAFANQEARPDHVRVHGILNRLVDRFGETAHYGVLDGHSVVYRSKVDPPSAPMKLSSVVGGRNPAHATALGKVLLAAALPTRDAIADWVGGMPLLRPADGTVWTLAQFCEELERTRERGYGIDDQENELGVNCLAVPVFLASPTIPSGAVSISALAHRTPVGTLIDVADEILAMVDADERSNR